MPEVPARIVVVGGGLAGAKAVEALRERGYDGSLVLVGDEADLPYERPPLSKGYLQGEQAFTDAVVHPEQWYAEHEVELRRGVAAMALDRAARQVELADGGTLGYDRLLLATGAVPRRLSLPGGEAAHYLRTHHDSDTLRAALRPGARVVVIGGGWIGLEVAAAARRADAAVTLVESAELPLLGVLGPQMARVFADLHREHGVELRLGARLEEIRVDGAGTATGVRLADGELDADLVVAGVGVAPEDSLARAAGLAVDDGVLVDAALRTDDPAVFACGDVANHAHPVLGRRVRVEHWASALNQPAVAAAAMLGEAGAHYDRLPYFFTDQYDLGMEYLGLATPDETDRVVVRGDLAGREFVAFWLDAGRRLLAAMNVNVWDVADALRPLIAERRVVDPDRLADASVGWDEL